MWWSWVAGVEAMLFEVAYVAFEAIRGDANATGAPAGALAGAAFAAESSVAPAANGWA